MIMKVITKSTEETIKLGEKIASQIQGGDIILLQGDLGAGKTTFMKGLAQGLNISENITSPTFTLMNVYPLKSSNTKQLVHIDTYRLKDEQELIDIGVEDYLGKPNTICVIEWPEKLPHLLENKKTTIVALKNINENQREIIVEF